MSNRKAPYKHSDGSNCWTKDCSRGHVKTGNSVADVIKQQMLSIQNQSLADPFNSIVISDAKQTIFSLLKQLKPNTDDQELMRQAEQVFEPKSPASMLGKCTCGHTESLHGNVGAKVCLRWDNGSPCGCKGYDGITDGRDIIGFLQRKLNARQISQAPKDSLEELVGETDNYMTETEGDFEFWRTVMKANTDGAIELPLEITHPELDDITDGLEEDFRQ